MDAIPEALTENTVGVISIDKLARIVEVEPERLRPLVEHGYLRVVTSCQLFAGTIVRGPGQPNSFASLDASSLLSRGNNFPSHVIRVQETEILDQAIGDIRHRVPEPSLGSMP